MSPLVVSPTLPDTSYRPGEITINPWSMQSLGVALASMALLAPQPQNYAAANLAVFVPFWVPEPIVITKMGWGNGAAVAGNLDAGVYDENGNLLISTGSTAQAGTSTIQVVDVMDTVLNRARYYLAMTSDTSGTTQKVMAVVPAAGIPQALGLLQMVAAPPLASNANPAVFAKYAQAFIPLVMAQGYRTVGP
jgi:hypothetical protein